MSFPDGSGRPDKSLVLYVAGTSRRALGAMGELRRFVDEHRHEHWHFEVIDVLQPEHRNAADGVLLTPTLVVRVGDLERRLVGRFDDLASCLLEALEARRS
ncbi:MAG: hypothetical protein L6Q99_00130 [Planctomycetes bacterium]|nr:hypothetical protein [Planctomycetota bacterium]